MSLRTTPPAPLIVVRRAGRPAIVWQPSHGSWMTTMHGHFHQCARESTFAVVPSFYDAGTRSFGNVCTQAFVRMGLWDGTEAPDRCLGRRRTEAVATPPAGQESARGRACVRPVVGHSERVKTARHIYSCTRGGLIRPLHTTATCLRRR